MSEEKNTGAKPPIACATSASCDRSRLLLPLMLAVVLAAIVGVRLSPDFRHGSAPDGASPPVDPQGRTVALSIDFGDGREREFAALPWHEGMTVDDMMTAASRLPDGITYTVTGSGAMAILVEIDGTMSDRSGVRNWTYSVNGKFADRSLGVYPLEPGDQVLWKFGARE